MTSADPTLGRAPKALWDRDEGTLRCRFLGRVEYTRALQLQESLIETSRAGEDQLLLLEHPPVYTTGRSGNPANLPADAAGVPVIRTGRGGDATFHGPGQLVGYPIVDLRRRGSDVHRYLRQIEAGLLAALASYEIDAHRESGRTGIWVRRPDDMESAKIASIGIAVRRGVAWHGFALNVDNDVRGFERITACGIPGIRMTSIMEAGSGARPSLPDVAETVARAMASALGAPAPS